MIYNEETISLIINWGSSLINISIFAIAPVIMFYLIKTMIDEKIDVKLEECDKNNKSENK